LNQWVIGSILISYLRYAAELGSRKIKDHPRIFRVISGPDSVTVNLVGGYLIHTAPYRRDNRRNLDLARVLLVDDDLASRLTLQTVLEAGGYSVDVAASAAEAMGKLDDQEYELVLSDLRKHVPEAAPSCWHTPG